MAPQYDKEDFKIANLYDVKGKVALVTGGGSGIGLMIVQALAINGAKVYITGRTEDKLEKVVELYGKDIEGQIIPISADISQKSGVAQLVKEIESRERCLCILVNNAGIQKGTHTVSESKNAMEMKQNMFDEESNSFEEWTESYRTNVASIYFLTTACLPLLQRSTEMQKGYSGCVINITSISGLVRVSQHHPAYNASKAAAVHVSNMLGAEFADAGLKIRVNNIAPGVYPSEMTTGGSGEDQKSHIAKEKFEGKVPADRPGSERDMASAVIFVATNQYLNGQTIAVDGGYVLKAGRV